MGIFSQPGVFEHGGSTAGALLYLFTAWCILALEADTARAIAVSFHRLVLLCVVAVTAGIFTVFSFRLV